MREHTYSSKLHPSLSPLLGAGELSASRHGRITPVEQTRIRDPCNENQLGALFILSLFHQSTSTCFGHIYSPSSGSILYIYNWYMLCFSTHSTGVWVSPEPVCTFLRKEKSLASGGIRTSYRLRYPDSQCVTGCTTHPQVSLLPF